jgi:D-alanyl-D-alanine carboxypeptidase/D-alanyl-D-alanine-endopeptidase (penicillin-binding protein 4)
MRLKFDRRVILVVLAAITASTRASGAGNSLADRLDELMTSGEYRAAHWGVMIVDAKTGETIFERNADQMFCPASVTKLFTTAAVLVDLGGDFRFKTPVVRLGDVDSHGALRGDLILVAQGDPNLGGRLGPDGTLLFQDHDHSYANGNFKSTLVPADPLAGLDHLARVVRESGIKEITGNILVDDRLFEPAQSTGSGPTRVSPILINDNVVDVVIAPGANAGDPAKVRIVPNTSAVAYDAQVETIAKGIAPSLRVIPLGVNRFEVRGRIPVGREPIVRIYEVDDPASFARSLFIERLRSRGVVVVASPLGSNDRDRLPDRRTIADAPVVAEFTSPPLTEELRVVLKVSQNLHASTLPLLVAARHGARTLDQALAREGSNLKKLGVDIDTISFGGGAGGSRSDLVTPRTTTVLLRAMMRRSDFTAYESALPVLGRDGTLADAVSQNSPARGHVRAKTGTYFVQDGLSGKIVLTSKSLAGYMETASGRSLVFAFFLNDVPITIHSDDDPEGGERAGKRLAKMCEACYADQSAKPVEEKPRRGD